MPVRIVLAARQKWAPRSLVLYLTEGMPSMRDVAKVTAGSLSEAAQRLDVRLLEDEDQPCCEIGASTWLSSQVARTGSFEVALTRTMGFPRVRGPLSSQRSPDGIASGVATTRRQRMSQVMVTTDSTETPTIYSTSGSGQSGFGRKSSRRLVLPRSSRRESREDFLSSTSSQAMTRIRTSGATLAARWKRLGSRTRSSSISMS